MPARSLEELSRQLQKIDFCMLQTKDETGAFSVRPMSNNGDVDYDGESYFFSYEQTRKVSDIKRDARVGLTFTAPPSLLGRPGIFLAIDGTASLIRDKAQFEAHWVKDLERWFPEGIDTAGIVLIKVSAIEIQYWDGEENGRIPLAKREAR
ncbi:pyridoxamine 5'-phosphate oxidase family protein [Rhizobium wenxiniae]|uniref:pyridoxamine 5'-phosphate oxidase family protein n=1 Tax=Rhizobium wenxiniae TaxID=1737357 RepID=UPI003C1C98D7